MFFFLFLLIFPPPPRSTLFPYTTLFRSDLVAADQGAKEYADRRVLRDETRDQEARRHPDPFRLVRDRPVQEDRAVRRERVVRQLEREEPAVVEPRHASDLCFYGVADGGLTYDRGADEIRNAVEEDAERGFDGRRHPDDVQRRGVDRRRLHARLLRRGSGPFDGHSPNASHGLFASSRFPASICSAKVRLAHHPTGPDRPRGSTDVLAGAGVLLVGAGTAIDEEELAGHEPGLRRGEVD